MEVVLILICLFVSAELALFALIRWHRPFFQWLITRDDECPEFKEDLVDKFIEQSFDPELGWMRKPQTTGIEKTEEGEKSFSVNSNGHRSNPDWENGPVVCAVYGDSFSFCRLVNDDETWPYYLSGLLSGYASNAGVGNYGLDQALLRYKREEQLVGSADYVIVGVVPESICRVHSYWRHYFEYGNILAFKPRFVADGAGGFVLKPSAVQSRSDFTTVRSRQAELQAVDSFYQSKFKRDQLRFPFTASLLRQPRRLLSILWLLTRSRLTGKSQQGFEAAFRVVMSHNAEETARLFSDARACDLFEWLMSQVVEEAEKRGQKPLIVILPQPVDLERRKEGNTDYDQFIDRVSQTLPVMDLTADFLGDDDPPSLYIKGGLGPHPSPRGNRRIAEWVFNRLKHDRSASH